MTENQFEKIPHMTVKKSIFIQALAMGKNTQESCRLANISYPTGFKWRKEENFDRSLLEIKSEIVRENMSKLVNALSLAVNSHIEILENPNTFVGQRLKVNTTPILCHSIRSSCAT